MAKKFQPDYEASDVLELYRVRYLDGDEGRLRSLATLFRELCKLEHAVEIPKQYKSITREVRTPFIRDAWHRVTSSLVAKPPVAHVTAKDDKREEYRQAANIAERFDMAFIERQNKQLGTDIVYNLAAQVVRDGESVLKVVHKPQAWANFPEGVSVDEQDMWKRGIDLPIAWRDVDRLQIVYEGGEYGDEWVLEYGEYAKPFLKARYKMGQTGERLVNPRNMLEGKPYVEGLNPSTTGRAVKVEFFTSTEWHVIIDGVEAPDWPKKNPYSPYLPYFRAKSFDSESLLYSLMFLVPRLDELLTMKLNWAYLGAYPNPILETIPNGDNVPALDGPFGNAGDSTENNNPITWVPGKLIDLPIGRKLSFLVPPPVGRDINDLVGIFKSLIDVAGIPSIMRGVGMAGDSGYLASQLRAAAEMAYKLVAMSSQRQLEKATEFSHWMIERVIRQTVYVHGWTAMNGKTGKPAREASKDWLGLSPKPENGRKLGRNVADLSLVGSVSMQYRPTLPTDEQARAMIALQLTNAAKPLLDRRHALETYLQEEDPDAILSALYVEQELEEEPLRSQVREQALKEAGIIPEPQPQNPLAGLVGPDGQSPLLPPGPGGIQNIPLENMPVAGQPGLPGVTMPMTPAPPQPQGIPGATGGRPAGTYPGIPGGPQGV